MEMLVFLCIQIWTVAWPSALLIFQLLKADLRPLVFYGHMNQFFTVKNTQYTNHIITLNTIQKEKGRERGEEKGKRRYREGERGGIEKETLVLSPQSTRLACGYKHI